MSKSLFLFCLMSLVGLTASVEAVRSIKTAAELNVALAAGKPVVLKFFSTSCGPCQAMVPIYKQFEQELPACVCLEADIALAGELTRIYGIRSVPAFFFFNNGKLVGNKKGRMTLSDLKATAKSFFAL